jgi:hypothetical protein
VKGWYVRDDDLRDGLVFVQQRHVYCISKAPIHSGVK